MSSTFKSGILRSWSSSIAIVSLFTVCFAGMAIGQIFPGSGTGAIPDRGAAGCGAPAGPDLDITFTVTGLPAGPPSSVSVDFTATHTWVGDLEAFLIAPDGTEHILFASTGSTTATGCGSADDLGDTYTFDNSGTDDWWALGNPYPGGTYQTTTAGDAPSGGAPTDMDAAFAGIPDQNGTWTLRINDSGGGDTGAVSAANLTLGIVEPPVGNKFMDFDGDGKADYAQARDNTPVTAREGNTGSFRARSMRERMQIIKENPAPNDPAAPADHGTNIQWFVNNSGDFTDTIASIGEPATDFITPGDFDGDGKSDMAVWRGASAPDVAFYILQSSDDTIREDVFGQAGDNPSVVADYDGDGIEDVAVFRCPSTAGQCNFFYRGSSGGAGGPISFVPWGNGTIATVFPATGDFDGDGKADFNIQREDPGSPGSGQFALLRSSDNGVQFVNWGLTTDFIAPGDYDGDGTSDFAVVRNNSGQLNWWVLASGGGIIHFGTAFGLDTDFITPADYDGDGATDLSVWRPDPGDIDNNQFYVLRSGDLGVSVFEYGIGSDYPPANSKVQ